MTIQGKPQPGDRNGYGVLYPLRFVGGDFEAGSGFELAKSSAQIILDAEAASEDGVNRGEFPANRRIGTQMGRYVHKNIRGTWETILRAAGLEGLTQLDPRIILDPSKFTVTNINDRRIRVKVGIQGDPAYTGSSKTDFIDTTLGA